MPRFAIPDIPAELVDESKRVGRKVWMREDLGLHDPALMLGWDWADDDPAIPADLRQYIRVPVSERIRNPEADLLNQFVAIRRDIEHMKAGQDVGLGVALFPGLHMVHFGTGPLATAFGSRWVIRDNEQPFFEPAIHTPEEAMRLRKPDLLRGGMLPLIYERIEYYNQATQRFPPKYVPLEAVFIVIL